MSNARMMIVGKYQELKTDLRKKSLSVTAYRQRLTEEIDPILKEFEEIDFEKVESFVGNLKTLQQKILEIKEKMDEIDETYNVE
jgi:chromosome segregation ATPase